MAGLNLDMDYFESPLATRLVGLLGRGAEALPLRLWCYIGKYHAENGRFTHHAGQEIEAIAKWCGPPGKMLEAMCAPGIEFLVKLESGEYAVRDWIEQQGHIAAFKAHGRAMVRKRWDAVRKKAADTVSNTGSITKGSTSGIAAGNTSALLSSALLLSPPEGEGGKGNFPEGKPPPAAPADPPGDAPPGKWKPRKRPGMG